MIKTPNVGSHLGWVCFTLGAALGTTEKRTSKNCLGSDNFSRGGRDVKPRRPARLDSHTSRELRHVATLTLHRE